MLYSILFITFFLVGFSAADFSVSFGNQFAKFKETAKKAGKANIRSEVAAAPAVQELASEMVHEEAGVTGNFIQYITYFELNCKNIANINYFPYNSCFPSSEGDGKYTKLSVVESSNDYYVYQNYYTDSTCMTQSDIDYMALPKNGCFYGTSSSLVNKVPRKFAKRPGVWFNLYSNQNQCPTNILPDANTATYVLYNVCIPVKRLKPR
jgi:hypothetical protein